jgi:hypothetical protein
MASLEELRVGASVRGISPDGAVTIEKVEWYGDQAVEVLYRDSTGAVRNRLVYRTDEPALELVTVGRAWSFDGAIRGVASVHQSLPQSSHLSRL